MILVCGEALFDVFLDTDRGASLHLDARPGGSLDHVADERQVRLSALTGSREAPDHRVRSKADLDRPLVPSPATTRRFADPGGRR
jgi:hypothetical protein